MPTATVEQLVRQLQRLPAHRASASRVLQLVDDPDASADDLGSVISTDPSMTARLLKMANSAAIGRQSAVGTVAEAVTVLGFAVVRSLAVSWAAGLFEGSPRALPDGYWQHSVVVACGATRLGGMLGVPPGQAYSAGLLHDLGQPLLLRCDPARYRRLLRDDTVDTTGMCDRERAVYGHDHGEIGALVLRSWALPEDLVDAVANHHRSMTPDDPPLRRAVALAEEAAQLLRPWSSRQGSTIEDLEMSLARGGLPSVDGEGLLAGLRADISSAALAL